jgi:hypothetical protein
MGLQTVAADEDLEQMSQETSIDEITQKLQEHLPES